MIISISGVPGSGKTSAGRILAERLGYRFYSVGGLRGKMALDRGLSLDELNQLGEKEAFTDKEVDDYQAELGQKEDNFVIEGRLSWHFIPQSFKIFLECEPKEAARRVFEVQRQSTGKERRDEEVYKNADEARQALDARVASDNVRYRKYYNLDYRDPSKFDLVLDTTPFKTPAETEEKIEEVLKSKKLI